MPLVSVVIPTFNRAVLLRETLESVLGQTHPDIEVIVADDGSTDNTGAVVAEYGGRVRYIQQRHRGHDGAARNLGLRACSGDFVAFVDSDDLWHPTKIDKQLVLFHRQPELAMVYSDGRCFDSTTGRTLYYLSQIRAPHSGMVAESLIFGNYIPTSSTVLRRSALESVGTFSEESVMRHSDWEMWLRIAARFSVGRHSEPLFDYRLHAANITRREDPVAYLRSHLAVLERAVRFAPEVYGPLKRAGRDPAHAYGRHVCKHR